MGERVEEVMLVTTMDARWVDDLAHPALERLMLAYKELYSCTNNSSHGGFIERGGEETRADECGKVDEHWRWRQARRR